MHAFSVKDFTLNSILVVLLKIHTGEKPYQCSHCEKTLSYDRHLKTNIKLHSGEKPYRCSHCDKEFLGNSYIIKYPKTQTGENS